MNTRNTRKYGHDGRFNQQFNQQKNDKKKIIEDQINKHPTTE